MQVSTSAAVGEAAAVHTVRLAQPKTACHGASGDIMLRVALEVRSFMAVVP